MAEGLGSMSINESKGVADFIATLLYAAPQIHMLHLMNKSYAQHTALGSLYEALPEMVDTIIEQYQGIEEVIVAYPATPWKVGKDPVAYVQKLYDFVDANRNTFPTSHIQSDMDLIQSTLASTLYKLVNLK